MQPSELAFASLAKISMGHFLQLSLERDSCVGWYKKQSFLSFFMTDDNAFRKRLKHSYETASYCSLRRIR